MSKAKELISIIKEDKSAGEDILSVIEKEFKLKRINRTSLDLNDRDTEQRVIGYLEKQGYRQSKMKRSVWANKEHDILFNLSNGFIGLMESITGNNEGIKALSDEDIKSIDKFFDSAGTGFENVINAAKKFGNRVISSYYKDNRAKYNW